MNIHFVHVESHPGRACNIRYRKDKMRMKSHSVANTLHAYRNRFSSLLNASDGLLTGRAIWLFYAIVFGVMATAGVIAYLLHYPFRVHGAMTPGNEILMRASLCCAALIATGVMSGLDKESWLAYGLGAKYRAAHFGFGLLTGAFSLSLMMAALVLAGGASVTRSPNLTGSSIESGILWILVFLLIGWSEELIFRGYVFFKLVRKVGPVAAAVRTSLVFGFAHAFNGGESVLGLVQVVLFGLIACFAIWRTRSLWWIAGACCMGLE
ncbi:MAG: CPBP family intramembrane glutamic endopeptidase [Pararobbsia sp.]